MGRPKKVQVEEVVDEVVAEEFVNNSNVEVHLDKDLNDPRNKPTVDGNSQPVVDINVPVE
jgi:transcription termination factor Rho